MLTLALLFLTLGVYLIRSKEGVTLFSYRGWWNPPSSRFSSIFIRRGNHSDDVLQKDFRSASGTYIPPSKSKVYGLLMLFVTIFILSFLFVEIITI